MSQALDLGYSPISSGGGRGDESTNLHVKAGTPFRDNYWVTRQDVAQESGEKLNSTKAEPPQAIKSAVV